MQGLTRRQEQTLEFIRRSIEQRGYPPTLREIGKYMGNKNHSTVVLACKRISQLLESDREVVWGNGGGLKTARISQVIKELENKLACRS